MLMSYKQGLPVEFVGTLSTFNSVFQWVFRE